MDIRNDQPFRIKMRSEANNNNMLMKIESEQSSMGVHKQRHFIYFFMYRIYVHSQTTGID